MNRINERDEISEPTPYTKAHRFKRMMKKITNSLFFHFFQLCSILIGIFILCVSALLLLGGPDGNRSNSSTIQGVLFFLLGIVIIYLAINWRKISEKKDKKVIFLNLIKGILIICGCLILLVSIFAFIGGPEGRFLEKESVLSGLIFFGISMLLFYIVLKIEKLTEKSS